MQIRRTLGCLASATALALGTGLLTDGATAAEAVHTPNPSVVVPLHATFNDPLSTDRAQQEAITKELIGLIGNAPKDSVITASMYQFNDPDTANALVAARNAGVRVRLILDPGGVASEYSQYGKLLAGALGTDPGRPSFVYLCGDAAQPALPREPRGCISTRTDLHVNTINHNKFFLFSQTGAAKNVVFQSSANLTTTQETGYYNNAVTVPDDARLYNAYLGYWEELLAQGQSASGLPEYHSVAQAGPYTAYFGPRRESAGALSPAKDPGTDTVVEILDKVGCGTAAQPTVIRVAMLAFTRLPVAQKLAQLNADGCQVHVLNDGGVTESGTLANMSSEVQAALTGKVRTFRLCAAVAADATGTGVRNVGLHSKYLLVEGTFDGLPGRKLVFTGSQNYTTPSLRGYDETILKVDAPKVYDDFAANFDTTLNGPTGPCAR